MALVYFNIQEAEFLEYTPLEFNRLLEIRNNEKIISYRADMERMRLQTMVLFNIQVADKDRKKTPHKFMPFEWDIMPKESIEETKELTEDEWAKYDTSFPAKEIKKKKNG